MPQDIFGREVPFEMRKIERLNDKKHPAHVEDIVTFRHACENHFFTDEDGEGELATETMVSNVPVWPSMILEPKFDEWRATWPEKLTHIVWYNK